MNKAKRKALHRKMRRWVLWGYIVPMCIHTAYREYRLVKGY